MRYFLIFLAIASSTSWAQTTYNAATASQADVSTAWASAIAGDTVVIPAGTATWTSTSYPPDGIILQGAGIGSTVLTMTATPHKMVIGGNTRITGIEFQASAGSNFIFVSSTQGWRIDHCRFKSTSTTKLNAVLAQGSGSHPVGLIDNCQMEDARILVTGPYTSAGQQAVWSTASPVGSGNTVIIEDCTLSIVDLPYGNIVDANYGGHYVVRYCDIIDTQVQAHSVQGYNRATRYWEIYENTFRQVNDPSPWTPIFLRGGTGVIYNNSVTGTWDDNRIYFDNVRAFDTNPTLATGGSGWDGNEAIVTGTHDGSANAATLTDSGQSWTSNEYISPTASANRWVYNLTDGSSGQITANSATTVTATLAGGTDNDWDVGDSYKITGGYPARDQIGRGVDTSNWSTYWNSPAPSQASEPVYIWGNTGFGSGTVYVHNGAQAQFLIQNNRDYIIGTAKPDYTAYTYPHPLRGESAQVRRSPSRAARTGALPFLP